MAVDLVRFAGVFIYKGLAVQVILYSYLLHDDNRKLFRIHDAYFLGAERQNQL
jgi:hypothetical protein